jgi:arginine N-succinyltransferase
MSHPIVRTAIAEDLEALHRLALVGGTGLTNLPPDRDALRAKIETSEAALDSEAASAGGAAILLIVELEGRPVATSCVFPRVGAEWPFYSYRLTRQAARRRVDSIRSVRDSRISTFAGDGVAGEPALIAAGTGARFRETRGTVGEDGTIDAGAVQALEVAPGDAIRHVAL